MAKLKKLEQQQSSIKKVEEFNALSHEMSHTDKERAAKELKISDLIDKISAEEDMLKQIQKAWKQLVKAVKPSKPKSWKASTASMTKVES